MRRSRQKFAKIFFGIYQEFARQLDVDPQATSLPTVVNKAFDGKHGYSTGYARVDDNLPAIVKSLRKAGFRQVVCSGLPNKADRQRFLNKTYAFETADYHWVENKDAFLQQYRQGNVISAKGEMQEVQPAEYLVLIDDSESTIQNIGIRKSSIHMFLYSHLGGSLYLHPSEDAKKETREKLAHMIEKELNEWRKLVAIRKEVSHYVVQPRPTPKEKCSTS